MNQKRGSKTPSPMTTTPKWKTPMKHAKKRTPKKVKSSTPKSRKSSPRKKSSVQKPEKSRMLKLALSGDDKLKNVPETVTIPTKWRQEDIMVALQKMVR